MNDRTGFDGWWEALQFDRAVMWFGRYVESKLNEYKNGKPMYSLSELLGDAPQNGREAALAMLGGVFGVIGHGR